MQGKREKVLDFLESASAEEINKFLLDHDEDGDPDLYIEMSLLPIEEFRATIIEAVKLAFDGGSEAEVFGIIHPANLKGLKILEAHLGRN
jgi:hypothetical protein